MISPCTGPPSLKPSLLERFLSLTLEKNLCDHWSSYRQQLVHNAGFIIIIRSKEWLISVPSVEVRRQMDGRLLESHLSVHSWQSSKERALESRRILIACVSASCGVLGVLVFLMSGSHEKVSTMAVVCMGDYHQSHGF